MEATPSPQSTDQPRDYNQIYNKYCCTEATFFKISLFVGGIFLLLGTIALLSQVLETTNDFIGEIAKFTAHAAEFIGTEPINLALYTITLSGTCFCCGIVGILWDKR